MSAFVAGTLGEEMDKVQGVRFSQMEQAVLAAAGDLFDRQGFNQTRMQDIADVLGLARPSLYHYFKNREQILAAGAAQVIEQRDGILAELVSSDGNPAERLEMLVHGLARLITENPVWIRILLRDDIALPEGTRNSEYRSRLAYFEALVDVLSEGVQQGFVRPLDERSTALTIVSALAGLRGHYIATTNDSPVQVTLLAVDVIMHGVLDPKRREGGPFDRGIQLINEGLRLIESSRKRVQPEPRRART
jgi:AcrR family transcriptional regulator